jgi:hypothetical protein
MTRKKATSETEAAKSTKEKNSKQGTKETNSADVRKTVSTMVKSKALAMAEAVIGGNEKGDVPKDLLLATVKYLFEVAAIYPPQSDQDAATADEDCLAKTLLHRLNIPDEPIRGNEEEEAVASVEKTSAKPAEGESEDKDAGSIESDEGTKPVSG